MSLLGKIEALWTEDKITLAEEWASKLVKKEKGIIDAGKKFHDWHPLCAYLSVTRATNPSISFSLRYQGQEVASLAVNGEKRQLIISHKTAETNARDFGVSTAGEYSWDAPEAVAFRMAFKSHAADKTAKITEHRIEAEFLKQMAIGACSKFKGTLKNIQPVLFAGFPLQLPLPISGNTGKPEATRGNIDILARRGIGKGTRVSIWELKKPNFKAHAIEQAYIYAVSLIKMLRSKKCGELWYKKIIGFSGEVPKKLTIESVVAVSFKDKNKKADFVSDMKAFKEKNLLQIENDVIKLYVAHYIYVASNKDNPLIIDELIEI